MKRKELIELIKEVLREQDQQPQEVPDVNQPPVEDDKSNDPKVKSLQMEKDRVIKKKQDLEAKMSPKQQIIDKNTKDLVPLKLQVSKTTDELGKINDKIEQALKEDVNVSKQRDRLDILKDMSAQLKRMKQIAKENGYIA